MNRTMALIVANIIVGAATAAIDKRSLGPSWALATIALWTGYLIGMMSP